MFAGGAHAGALSTDGRLWLWGSNTHGQLGHTDSRDAAVVAEPRLVARGSLAVDAGRGRPRVVSVGLGWRHSVVLDADDRVHTWGHSIAARAAAHVFAFRGETHLGHGPGAAQSLRRHEQQQQHQLLQLTSGGGGQGGQGVLPGQEPQELPVIVQPAQVSELLCESRDWRVGCGIPSALLWT